MGNMTLNFNATHYYYHGAFIWHFIFAICKINDLILTLLMSLGTQGEHITLLFN